jgi:uncharacterized protein (DUF1501 family)
MGRVLVVIQLDGGNDGLNTVVPFGDDNYSRLRKRLRLASKDLIKLNDSVGLHPSMKPMTPLLENGELAIVTGLGYPNPSRSHFQSMAIWHTARFDPEEHKGLGWIGRALDAGPATKAGAPGSCFVGLEMPPVALRGRRVPSSALASLDDFALANTATTSGAMDAPTPGDDLADFVRRVTVDAYTTAVRVKEAAPTTKRANYPDSDLARRLSVISRLLQTGYGASIFYTLQPGYDTHAQQMGLHAGLLSELSSALAAFFADLKAAKLADRVAVLVFSEFGRTVQENASGGTDHGSAGPVFLAGPGVKGGLAGSLPSLTDLDHGEPKMTVDFRRVYATVLEKWLGLTHTNDSLGGSFETMSLFKD